MGIDQARDNGSVAQVDDRVGLLPNRIKAANRMDLILIDNYRTILDRRLIDRANPFGSKGGKLTFDVQQCLLFLVRRLSKSWIFRYSPAVDWNLRQSMTKFEPSEEP